MAGHRMAGHWYRAYGLLLRSEIELPEFLAARPGAGGSNRAHDLDIRLSDHATAQWAASGAGESDAHRFFAAPAGGFVMRVPGVVDFWVREGRAIALGLMPGADLVSVRLFLLGSALGMALHQRGLPVLHGATVLHGRGATIFVGESGQGKSTLAASLGRSGHAILGDDTMPLWRAPRGGFEVWPGSRMFKLWADTIDVLGETAEGLDSVGSRLDKYFFPNAEQPADRPSPLGEIIELVSAPEGAEPALEPLGGLEALRVIAANTYRPHYVSQLGRDSEHFRLCSELAGSIAVCRLSRPRDIRRIGESLALIRARWAAPDQTAGAAP
ncbi:MAG TPA: hypothetical protein VMM59_07655 [Thermohalobaculum sp.]|nr:hypothetical protein [Thermohalobaculum sp.]